MWVEYSCKHAAADLKVKEILGALLAKPPTSLEAAHRRLQHETRVILGVLDDLNIKAE